MDKSVTWKTAGNCGLLADGVTEILGMLAIERALSQ
jgi:hypothetical protein